MQSAVKYIGLLGLGSHSTTYYLKQLNAHFNLLNGGFSTCPLKMLNVNFELINPYLPHDFGSLEPVVSESIHQINQLGITSLVVPNITLHETIDRLGSFDISVIHPVHETAKKLQYKGVKEVVIFGSIFTMEGKYIPSIFSQYNVQSIQPSDEDKNAIDKFRKLIYEKGYSIEIESKIMRLVEKYMEFAPAVLACTELSLILENFQHSKLYDLVQIQIEAAIESIS